MYYKKRLNSHKKEETHKPTSIAAEQYLWVQLNKNAVDMLDNILKHLEKQTKQDLTHSNNRWVEENTLLDIMSDTQQGIIAPIEQQVRLDRKKIHIRQQSEVTVSRQMKTMPYTQDMENRPDRLTHY